MVSRGEGLEGGTYDEKDRLAILCELDGQRT